MLPNACAASYLALWAYLLQALFAAMQPGEGHDWLCNLQVLKSYAASLGY